MKKELTPNKKHKQKIIDKTFSDQLEDAWHLIEKRKKLKRKELFIKIEDTKQKKLINTIREVAKKGHFLIMEIKIAFFPRSRRLHKQSCSMVDKK